MRVLVTGGAGFVGTNLIKRLLKDKHEVVSVDNYSTGKKENEQEGCKYYDLDLSGKSCASTLDSIKTVSQISNFDVIFHLAALARIQTSLKNPYLHIENNFISTLNILEFARENDTALIYAGSSSKHHGVTNSPYSWVKWSGEELCKLYSDVYDVPTSICRFYNVYGPHQLEDGEYSTVVGIFMRQFKRGEPLTIVGDGEQRRDFTHIEDIVNGLVKCMAAMHGMVDMRYAGAEWEFGSGVNHSINELASYFGSDYPTKYIPARRGEYPSTLCEDKSTNDALDWHPTKKLDDFIKNFLRKRGLGHYD